MKERPMVVLAGWLGCQRRQLRRYEQMYEGLGFQVLSEVATPSMVVTSCFHPVAEPPVIFPASPWPAKESSLTPKTMQQLAWNVLQDVHHSDCPWFIFHAFSNGGCLLWEEVRRVLGVVEVPGLPTSKISSNNNNGDCNEIAIRQTLASLGERTRGLVLDSCPSRRVEGVGRVLYYCSWQEWFQVIRDNGVQVLSSSAMSDDVRQRALRRGEVYWNSIQNDSWHLPQLYLYSVSDALIPHQDLDELFELQQHRLGKDRALRCRWDESRHCAHLLDHPSEYESAVASFAEICRVGHQGETTRISKL